jgi:hypothetical protein
MTIHHTDTVSVIVGCSLNPFAADLKGLVRLSNALTRVEERLLRYIECALAGTFTSSIKFMQIMYQHPDMSVIVALRYR